MNNFRERPRVLTRAEAFFYSDGTQLMVDWTMYVVGGHFDCPHVSGLRYPML
jgi:hypothetical protein